MPSPRRRAHLPRRAILTLALHAVGTMIAVRAAETGVAGAIPFRRDDPARYRNFVVNWDAGAEVLCAVVRTPADYGLLFHPAPVIGGRKPFAPPDHAFDKEHLLVIARVVGGDGGSELAIERVVQKEDAIEVHGRFRPSGVTSSFSIKQAAIAWIPAREPGRVTFFENGEPVAALDGAKDAWVAPPLTEAGSGGR